MDEDHGDLTPPPLFVTAMSRDGTRHEGLVERGSPTPSWFEGDMLVRVSAPSGVVRDYLLDQAKQRDGYTACLSILGSASGWAPEIIDPPPADALIMEIWTPQADGLELREGPIIELHSRTGRPAARRGALAGDQVIRHGMTCYAVVRQGDGSSVYVPNTGRFYFDVSDVEQRREIVPRALLDTGLAGAFWGFVQHQNAPAALLVAERLLHRLFDEGGAQASSTAWNAAAAHAVLTHRCLLAEYGDRVLGALRRGGVPKPDAPLLEALVGMALLSSERSQREEVKRIIRVAVASLAVERPVFGETIRWLDAKFSILRDVVLQEFAGPDTEADVAAIESWLGRSYAGGQIAAYRGELPSDALGGWHDMLAAQKKTPHP